MFRPDLPPRGPRSRGFGTGACASLGRSALCLTVLPQSGAYWWVNERHKLFVFFLLHFDKASFCLLFSLRQFMLRRLLRPQTRTSVASNSAIDTIRPAALLMAKFFALIPVAEGKSFFYLCRISLFSSLFTCLFHSFSFFSSRSPSSFAFLSLQGGERATNFWHECCPCGRITALRTRIELSRSLSAIARLLERWDDNREKENLQVSICSETKMRNSSL